MERRKTIYPTVATAEMMAKDFKAATGNNVTPDFLHYLAKKLGYTKKRYGKEVYYSKSLYSDLWRHYPEYTDYCKGKEEKCRHRPFNSSYDPDKWIEPDKSPRFYDVTESVMRYVIESLHRLSMKEDY